MPNELSDAGFQPSFPSWLLVPHEMLVWNDDGTASLASPSAVMVMPYGEDDGAAVVVFDNELAVGEFCNTMGLLDDVEAIPADRTFLADILQVAAATNYADALVYNPVGMNDTRRIWVIKHAADRLRKGLPL